MESGKVILDFQIIESTDPKILMVSDSSMWKHIKEYPSIIEMIIPGRTKPVIHYFDKERVNIYNSLTLGVNCISGCQPAEYVDLPDGIYNFVLKGSPDKFCKEKNYLRDVELNIEIKKQILAIVKGGMDQQKVDKIQKAKMYLDAANGAITFNNVQEASTLYQKAKSIVDKLKNCKNCG